MLVEPTLQAQRFSFELVGTACLALCEKREKDFDDRISRRSTIDIALGRLVVRQAEALKAIRLLHKHHSIEANMVVRHMYEAMVNAVAIAYPIDTKYSRHELAYRFILYSDMVEMKRLERILMHISKLRGRVNGPTPAEIAETRRRGKRALARAGLTKVPNVWHPWSSFHNLYGKVKEAIIARTVSRNIHGGLESWEWNYDANYRLPSSSVHGDWSSILSRVDFKTDPPVFSMSVREDAPSMFSNAPTVFIQTLRCFTIHKGIDRQVWAELKQLIEEG